MPTRRDVLVVAGVALAGCLGGDGEGDGEGSSGEDGATPAEDVPALSVSSSAFEEGTTIPQRFAGDGADVVLPPTDSVSLAARHLKDLPTGDRTPLPAGLTAAREVLDRADPDAGVVVVVTDGRANAADGSPVEATRTAARALGEAADRTVVVDAGDGSRAGLLDLVAGETDARVVSLDALSAERVDAVAGER